MSNSTTEQKATSQDKSIIQGIGFKEFSSICQEYQVVEKATKELLKIANDKNTPVRTKVDIYKWVVEMNVGKPKQMDIPLEQEQIKPLSAGVFIKWEDDNTEDILTNELISRGMTKEQIDTLINQQLVENDV